MYWVCQIYSIAGIFREIFMISAQSGPSLQNLIFFASITLFDEFIFVKVHIVSDIVQGSLIVESQACCIKWFVIVP
jgi:hypothetical protein